VHGFARRRVGRQEAEDVVRDAYLHFVQRGTAATLEQPRAYLIRTAANLAVDFARKAKIRSAISQPSAHSNSRNVMVAPPPLKRSLRAYPGASALHGGWRDHMLARTLS
jgi:DNA-directed RNA polymerase specialized sigma24 family protein